MDEQTRISEAAKELSKKGAAKGGIARAQSLTPEERSEIARKAVGARWEKAGKYENEEIQEATHPGVVNLIGKELPCAVLKDGTRVLSEHGMTNALLGVRSGAAKRLKRATQVDGAPLPLFVASQNLKPFISDELYSGLKNPIKYRTGNRIALGYPAVLLPQICDVWLKAREAGKLNKQQEEKCKKAELLMRGFAYVGIIALIDEATGYQEVRDKLALQKILEMYIVKELRPWMKTFPDEFYEHLFRLRGWQYRPLSVKRPVLVANLTIDLVYSRIAPGVLDELKKLTPRDDKGRTKHRYFQHLTEDIGHPKLREHLDRIITLMKASPGWPLFYRLVERALPRFGKTIELPFNDIDINEAH
jgi:hypothetical protein